MKVMIGIDDSPFSSEMVNAVCKRHWTEDTQFCVVTVVEPVTLEEFSKSKWADVVMDTHARRIHRADKLCNDARQELMDKVPSCIVHYDVREGDPREELIEAATEWSADKIMIGTHGRGACPHFMLGSVSREVSRSAQCSVEVVRPRHSKAKATA